MIDLGETRLTAIEYARVPETVITAVGLIDDRSTAAADSPCRRAGDGRP